MNTELQQQENMHLEMLIYINNVDTTGMTIIQEIEAKINILLNDEHVTPEQRELVQYEDLAFFIDYNSSNLTIEHLQNANTSEPLSTRLKSIYKVVVECYLRILDDPHISLSLSRQYTSNTTSNTATRDNILPIGSTKSALQRIIQEMIHTAYQLDDIEFLYQIKTTFPLAYYEIPSINDAVKSAMYHNKTNIINLLASPEQRVQSMEYLNVYLSEALSAKIRQVVEGSNHNEDNPYLSGTPTVIDSDNEEFPVFDGEIIDGDEVANVFDDDIDVNPDDMNNNSVGGSIKKSKKSKKNKRTKNKKTKKNKRIRKGGVPPPSQRTWQRNEDDAKNHPVLVQINNTIADDTHTNITLSFLRAYVNYDILLNVYLSTPTPEEGYNYAANYFSELESRVQNYLRTIDNDKVLEFYETFYHAIDLDNPNSAANRQMRRLNEDRFLVDEGRTNRGLAYYEEISRLRQVITEINRIVSAVGGRRRKKSKTRRRVKKRKNKKTRKYR
jgi:hypothetical protein